MKLKQLTSYDSYKQAQILVSKWGSNDRLLDIKNELIDTLGLTKDSFILDIGCRRGQGIRSFLQDGYKNSYGIDIGSEFIMKDEYDSHFITCDAHDTLGFNQKYDFISIIHTLEHAYDASKILSLVHENLNKDGIVYIVVPHGEIENSAHYFACEHLDDLDDLFKSSNFEIVGKLESARKNNKPEYAYFLTK